MSNELYHFGIKGMRWGIRRYQNKDGTLTPAGERRRKKLQDKEIERLAGEALGFIGYRLTNYKETLADTEKAKKSGARKEYIDENESQLRRIAIDFDYTAEVANAAISRIRDADLNALETKRNERRGKIAVDRYKEDRLPGRWLTETETTKIYNDSKNAEYEYTPEAPVRKKK